tara:strand:- start:266 stop:469 length:204 start_codon:yes stop_codon:yes gene_type:complete
MKLRNGELVAMQTTEEDSSILGISMEDYDSIYDGEEVLIFWLDSPPTHPDNCYKTEKYYIRQIQEMP